MASSSVQKNIYCCLGVTGDIDITITKKSTEFCYLIGWKQGRQWLDYNSLPFNLEASEGNLPALAFYLAPIAWIGVIFEILFSRVET